MAEQSDSEKEVAYITLRTGEVVGINQLVRRHKENFEAQLNSDLLKSGDAVVFSYPKDDKDVSFVFEVKESGWEDLGVGGNPPSRELIGQVSGDLKDITNESTVVLGGSGFGGSLHEPGVIATGRDLRMFVPGRGTYKTPKITSFEVLRRNEEGNLKPIEPNQLNTKDKEITDRHEQLLKNAERLMKLFKFDDYNFRDGSKSSHDEHAWKRWFQDGRYRAQYEAGMAMGNQLAIYDEQTALWMEFKYFNFKNDDILQVAFADLSARQIDEIMPLDRLVYESTLHAEGVPITTFVSSGRYGLEAVIYKPSDDEYKKIAESLNLDSSIILPMPDLQFYSNGAVDVSTYNKAWLTKNHPEVLGRLKSLIKVDSQGKISGFDLNEERIDLVNCHEQISNVLQYMESKAQQ